MHVVIVDSSDLPCSADFPEQFDYYHEPGLAFAAKILFGLTKIEGNLVVLSPDDDFLVCSSLALAANTMQNDCSISLSFGPYMAFDELSKDNVRYLPMLNLNKKYYLSNKSKKRKLNRFMKNYDQVLWSMYRKDTIEMAFRSIEASEFKNDNFIEVCIAATALYVGNINIGANIWGFREQSIGEHWGLLHGAISNQDERDVEKFIDQISFLANREYASEAISLYIKYSLHRRVKSKLINLFQKYFMRKPKVAVWARSIKEHLET